MKPHTPERPPSSGRRAVSLGKAEWSSASLPRLARKGNKELQWELSA